MSTQTWNSEGYSKNARFVTDLGTPLRRRKRVPKRASARLPHAAAGMASSARTGRRRTTSAPLTTAVKRRIARAGNCVDHYGVA